MTSRVRIIKRNNRSYIVYRRLHNYRLTRNPLIGWRGCYANFLFKGEKHKCKLVGNYWVARI